MVNSERLQRGLAYGAVGAVWLFAVMVGLWIGLDIGHSTFG